MSLLFQLQSKTEMSPKTLELCSFSFIRTVCVEEEAYESFLYQAPGVRTAWRVARALSSHGSVCKRAKIETTVTQAEVLSPAKPACDLIDEKLAEVTATLTG